MTKGKSLASMVTIAVVLSLFSQPAHANMGIPMLALVWPVMAMALVPIIIVESTVLVVGYGMAIWHSAWVVSVANLASTVIGIPVTWLFLLLIALFAGAGSGYDIDTAKGKFLTVTFGAPWLPPYEDRAMNWMVPAACFVLLIPFFFASWFVEYEVGIWFLDEMNARNVSNAVLMGNLITYGILGAIVATITLHQFWITAKTVQPVYRTLDWIAANMSAEKGIGYLKSAEAKIARNRLVLIQGQTKEAEERTTEKHVDSAVPIDPWRFANERARRGIAKLRAKEAEIVRRYQDRSRCSDKSWRLANKRARRGIAWLRTTETAIDRQRPIQAAAGVRRFVDAYDVKAA